MTNNINLSVDAAQELLSQMEQNRKRKEQYKKENYIKWNDEGIVYRQKRQELGLSLRFVGEKLGTSATRIRNFEIGEPVSQVEHLKASYRLLFNHIEMRNNLGEFIKMNFGGINPTGIMDWSEGDVFESSN